MIFRKFTLSSLGLSLMIATLSAHAAGLTSVHSAFGTTADGAPIEKYTLSNSHGMQASIITWGGVLQSLIVPDKNGKADDVVLGFDDIQATKPTPRSISARRSVGSVIASRTASSRWTARSIKFRPTTARTPCTAAAKALTSAYGKPRTAKKKVGWA